MKQLKYLIRNWELIFAFGPIVIGLVSWLIIGLIGLMFDFPAPLDMDQYTASTLSEKFGAFAYELSTGLFILCMLAWFPFLVAGLTVFGFRVGWSHHRDKKTERLHTRINELRKKNAKD